MSGGAYVRSVETAIHELEKAITDDLALTVLGAIKRTDIKQLKGDAAEFWHAYTHNIDAAVPLKEVR